MLMIVNYYYYYVYVIINYACALNKFSQTIFTLLATCSASGLGIKFNFSHTSFH